MAEQAAIEWEGEGFNQMRQSIMNRFQCSEEEASARMKATLDLAFQNLLEEPQPPPPNPPLSPPPNPPPTPPADDLQPPQEGIAFPEIDEDAMIDNRAPLLPLQFTITKIQAMEYVDLWYFTTEGCKEASQAVPTTPDTFGLLNTEAGLAFQPINAAKPSKKAIIDEHLGWEQIMTARHTFINMVRQAGWAPHLIQAWAEFYIKLEGLKADGRNPRVLILYHATARRQWHQVRRPGAKRFNLSLINTALLNTLENQIRDHDHEALQRQASPVTLLTRKPKLTAHRFLSPPLHIFHLSSLFHATLHTRVPFHPTQRPLNPLHNPCTWYGTILTGGNPHKPGHIWVLGRQQGSGSETTTGPRRGQTSIVKIEVAERQTLETEVSKTQSRSRGVRQLGLPHLSRSQETLASEMPSLHNLGWLAKYELLQIR